MCPCAGDADRARYDSAVDLVRRTFAGDATAVTDHMTARMTELAAAQRFEEAMLVRDRLSALLGHAPIVETVGHRAQGLDRLMDAALRLVEPTRAQLRLIA